MGHIKKKSSRKPSKKSSSKSIPERIRGFFDLPPGFQNRAQFKQLVELGVIKPSKKPSTKSSRKRKKR